jgi:two-component system, chemotaxis family, chemotaxis protein CheY
MFKILIVDDMAVSRLMLKKMLMKAGYEIVEDASDLTEAINKYQTLQPDLVFMDIAIPGKVQIINKKTFQTGGIEAIKEIIRIDEKAKIIAFSAMNFEAIVLEVLKAGAKDYILKPVEFPRLLEAIKKVIS